MALADIYPNIPGFVAQINDFGLSIPPAPTAQSQGVLLLGIATDGPVNTPVPVTSIQMAETLYGITNAPTGAGGQTTIARSLTRGLYEAFQAGCTDVRLCRVGGISASATLTDSATAANSVTLTAVYAGAKYNTLAVSYALGGSATGGTVTLTTTDGVAHPIPLPFGATYGDLLNAINNSGYNIQANQTPTGNFNAVVNLTAMGTTSFTGGADGTSMTDTQYSNALSAAYNQLEDYDVDVVVPLGAFLQPSFNLDGSGNPTVPVTNSGDTVYYGQNLAQFLARMSQSQNQAFGIISIAPMLAPTFVTVNQRVAQLAVSSYNFTYSAGYSVPGSGPAAPVNGTDGLPVNLGRFVNIVAGPDFIVNNARLGNYITDASCSYAGKAVSLAPQSGTTNKVIPNILGLAYTYGQSAMNTLAGRPFTIFQYVNGTVRTVADNTYAPNGLTNPVGAKASDFQKLSTVRITYAAVNAVRNATQSYIGEGNTPALVNAMATDIDSALGALKSSQALIDYQFQLVATSSDQILGNMNVILTLVPALEIRKITIAVTLQAPGAINSANSGSTT